VIPLELPAKQALQVGNDALAAHIEALNFKVAHDDGQLQDPAWPDGNKA
jgi:regulator of PEP synthase PpsR (kinase-PPPase family)